MPMTPMPTPTPMPMAALVGRPDDDVPPDGLPVGSPAVGPVVVTSPGIGKVDEVVGGVEEGAGDVVVDVLDGSISIFHPTTAMAPTLERLVSVVVSMDHSSGDPTEVEAKVSTAPDVTSDRQSPAMEPGVPRAR